MAAMQHGLAIAGTKGPLTDEMLSVEDGRSFLLADWRSTEAYANCVRTLLENKSLRLELGRNAKELFDRHFAWDIISNSLLKILREKGPRTVEATPACEVSLAH